MAVAVVHGTETVYAKGFGVKDVKTGEKVDPDTVFQLASVSKPVTATVVAQQVGENAIGWDTPGAGSTTWVVTINGVGSGLVDLTASTAYPAVFTVKEV